MSTFPLVQVEGALAMPHMRPLNRVPPPFGREWSLMPSHFSLRTELHALYAAFLRTICLSAEAFRKVYSWERQPRTVAEPPRPAAAPVGAAMSAAQAQQAAAEALGGRAAGVTSAQPAQRAPTPQAGHRPPASHKLTASAVAIGGAALLAWIVASHTQLRDDKNHSVLSASATPASKTDTQSATPSSTRLADERALHDRSISGPVETSQVAAASDIKQESGVAIGSAVVAQRTAPVSSAVSSAAPVALTTTPATTPVTAPAQRVDQLAATTGDANAASALVDRPDFTMRTQASKPALIKLTPKAASEKRIAVSPHQATRAAARTARNSNSLHAMHEFAPHHGEPLVPTQRTQGMYSEAAEYSPHQFAVNANDEYPSLTTYAGTRTAQRSVSRAPVATDSTDWVNHVAQRRVTEVPDRFAK